VTAGLRLAFAFECVWLGAVAAACIASGVDWTLFARAAVLATHTIVAQYMWWGWHLVMVGVHFASYAAPATATIGGLGLIAAVMRGRGRPPGT
jgi:hypothetical protein